MVVSKKSIIPRRPWGAASAGAQVAHGLSKLEVSIAFVWGLLGPTVGFSYLERFCIRKWWGYLALSSRGPPRWCNDMCEKRLTSKSREWSLTPCMLQADCSKDVGKSKLRLAFSESNVSTCKCDQLRVRRAACKPFGPRLPMACWLSKTRFRQLPRRSIVFWTQSCCKHPLKEALEAFGLRSWGVQGAKALPWMRMTRPCGCRSIPKRGA